MVCYTKLDADDDPQYLDWVQSVVAGVEEQSDTDQTCVGNGSV
jgi:hypothetical protein